MPIRTEIPTSARVIVSILCVAALACCAQARAVRGSEPQFSPAYAQRGAGAVTSFAPIAPIDWEDALRRSLGADAEERVRADLARLHTGEGGGWEPEVSYVVSLPDGISRGRHTLASPQGLEPLTLTQLRVIVREMSDGAFYRYGEVLATSRTERSLGGFVIWSRYGERPQLIERSRTRLARLPSGTLLEYADRDGAVTAGMPERWFSEVGVAYGILIDGRKYLFVAWPADPNGTATNYCESNTSLYRIDQTLTLIAHNHDGCDL